MIHDDMSGLLCVKHSAIQMNMQLIQTIFFIFLQGYSFLTTMQSDDDGNIMMPTDENFPNIPGNKDESYESY